MTTIARWRKGRASAQEANCVEVAHTLGAVRDSKNVTGPVLRGDVSALVTAIRADRISR
jgi:hypothetical protein